LDPEDVAAAATFPSYFDAGSDQEEAQAQVPVPSKKPTGTTSKSSKKKPDQQQEKVETEYKKASEHPDLAKIERSRKRGTTEGPDESVNSPKKVCPPYLPATQRLTGIG
jgi:hypothetical protein